MQSSIEYKDGFGVRKYNHTPSRKHVGKAIARRSKTSLIFNVLKDPITKVYVIKKVGILLKQELAEMCSNKANSFLRNQSPSSLVFKWDTLLGELAKHAPILLSLFLSCTTTNRPRQNRSAVIWMCCAFLLKFRY